MKQNILTTICRANSEGKTTSQSRVGLKGALLVLTVFILYSPAFFAPFYFDDYDNIVNKLELHDLSWIKLQVNSITNFVLGRGLTKISFMIDWYFHHARPGGFHLTSIVLHCTAVLLAWRFVNQITHLLNGDKSEAGRLDTGFWAALFFAIHPMNTEAVTYIIQRSEVIALVIYLAAFLVEIWLIRRTIGPEASIKQTWPWLLAMSFTAAVGTGLGMGGKLTAITLPAMVLITLLFANRTRPLSYTIKQAGIFLTPMLAGAAAFTILRYSMIAHAMSFPDMTVRSFGTNFLTQMKVIVTYYLPRIVFPIRLNYDPQIAKVTSFWSLDCLVPIVVILFLLVLAYRTFRTHPVISFGIFWFLITISPTSSFAPLLDLVAERRVYMPMVGVGIIIGSLLNQLLVVRSRIPEKKRLAAMGAAAVLLALLTIQRNVEYTNPIGVWYKSAAMSPKKMRPLCNYVHSLVKNKQGNEALQTMKTGYNGLSPIRRDIEDGYSLEFLVYWQIPNNINVKYTIDVAEQYVRNDPKNIRLLEILQQAYLLTNRFDDLERIVDYTLSLDDKNIKTLQNKALLYRQKGDLENAWITLHKASVWAPEYPPVLQELSDLNKQMGKDNTDIQERLETINQRKEEAGDELFYYSANINAATK